MKGEGGYVADCPKCGCSNPAGAEFCANPNCRTYLGFVTGTFPAPGHPAQPRDTSPMTVVGVAPVGSRPASTPQGPPEGQRRGVRVRLEPTHLTVEPGSVATATVSVRNTGTRVEEFRLAVTGPAATFTTVEPATLTVYPDSEESAVLRFSPRRSPEHPAAEVPYAIYAGSVLHTDVVDHAQGAVVVQPFHELQAVMQPESSRGRKAALHHVVLTNAGNAPVGVQVALSDRDSVLRFEPPETGTTLVPGQRMSLPVRVTGPRSWFGRTQPHPFTALVTPTGRTPVTLNGTRHQVPMFPWWIPTAMLAVLALLLAAVALLPKDKVPSTTGLTEAAATKVLNDKGYQVVVIPQPHPSIPDGVAIKTDPSAGAQLDSGEIVQLFVSTGPCTGECPIEIPDVEGLPLDKAQDALKAAGFKVGRVNKVPNGTYPDNFVVSTKPAAGTPRPRGSEVVITVSNGSASPADGDKKEVSVPTLRGQSATAATDQLTQLGFSVRSVEVHSNELAAGKVLGTEPAAGAMVAPGAQVTLRVARPTGRIDLIEMADEATWRSGAGELPFPGAENDQRGFALIRDNTLMLEDGSVDKVLETHPQWVADGYIAGRYELPDPIIRGDHLRADVGLLKNAGGAVEFVVMVNGRELGRLSDSADGQLKAFDVDLSSAQGSKVIEIHVYAGPSAGQDWAIWRDLRVEGQVG